MNETSTPSFSSFPPPRICLLADVPGAVAVLSRWFVEEWAPWYGPDGEGDALADLEDCRRRDALPLAVVALDEGGRVLGTAALKRQSLGSEPGLGPWLAAMLVGPAFRGRGVGDALVGAIEAEARRMGFKRIHVATDTAARIVTRRGWQPEDRCVTSLRGDIPVLFLDLNETRSGPQGKSH